MRMQAGRRCRKTLGGLASTCVAIAVMAGGITAKTPNGTWGVPFDHELITTGPTVPNPNATDHLVPFGGYLNAANISYYSFGPLTFDWPGKLNAVHMALIPKGLHQGKVIVFGATTPLVGSSVLLKAPGFGPPLQSNQYHTCNAWSIVDPSPTPTGPRFRNYLLPLDIYTVPPNPLDGRFPSLFCTGHVWSPYGDLIVVGGTRFGGPLLGPKLTFAFNPRRPTRGWPTSITTPLYPVASDPGAIGMWGPGPDLLWDRFYPTALLTARLSRLGGAQPPRETVLVAGGSRDDLDDDWANNETWNNYEALVINAEADVFASGLVTDTVAGQSWWYGPGTQATAPTDPPPVEEDWLEDYPRLHLLSTGEAFFSGYAPRWARLDHDLNPGVWNKQAAPPWSTNWQYPRHDGASILFPNVGGLKDMVVRMGGADEVNYAPAPHGTTATIEAYIKQGAGGFWAPAGNLPTPPGYPSGRYLMNVVTLPDASLLLLGGVARNPVTPAQPNPPQVPVHEPLLYKNGVWHVLQANPVTSVRDYHSSAVLLPDGRVMLGGGNTRDYDYEIYSPHYMQLPKPQGVAFRTPVVFDPDMTAFTLNYNTTYEIGSNTLPLGEYIQKVVLMAPGSTTHHSDMHARYVETVLDTTAELADGVAFTTPLDDKHAPRGIYMLFLVTSAGAVSDAIWVVMR